MAVAIEEVDETPALVQLNRAMVKLRKPASFLPITAQRSQPRRIPIRI